MKAIQYTIIAITVLLVALTIGAELVQAQEVESVAPFEQHQDVTKDA